VGICNKHIIELDSGDFFVRVKPRGSSLATGGTVSSTGYHLRKKVKAKRNRVKPEAFDYKGLRNPDYFDSYKL
jgi:hypothetical protein